MEKEERIRISLAMEALVRGLRRPHPGPYTADGEVRGDDDPEIASWRAYEDAADVVEAWRVQEFADVDLSAELWG